MKIQVNHIGKMEGHADFIGEIIKGNVKSAKIMTTEGSRLIEGILVGRHFSEAPIITSRICGICPVVHKVSSIKALENALGIKPTEQTVKLRKAMLLVQIIHSHALHLFFLSLPDFFGLTNDLAFISQHKKETEAAIRVRDWALKVVETIGGRAVHPIACEVGGFKVLPQVKELRILADQYESILKDALILVNMVLKIKMPKFQRETAFIALTNEREYAFYGGDVKIAKPGETAKIITADKFTKRIKEIEDPYRAAKSATLDGEPFMVGALSRINLNYAQLNPLARGILNGFKWKLPQYNIFHNITSQAIEVVHCLEESHKLLNELTKELRPEKSQLEKYNIIGQANPWGKETVGADAVEAPRGTLYHHYKVNADGYLREAQIITPTVSFLRNLEADITKYLSNVKNLPEKKRAIKIRALIRAYDPCISCATH